MRKPTTLEDKRPTMKDVALRAGVSVNVVSRVCRPRSGEYVSASARAKVDAAVAELGYYPDSRARYLRSQRTHSIGFYSAQGQFGVWGGFSNAIFDGVQHACAEHSQDILIFHSMRNRSLEDAARMLASSKVDGLIHMSYGENVELSEALLGTNKPIVRVGEPFHNTPAVLADDFGGSVRIARHLHARGHRRIMYRKSGDFLTSGVRRCKGFLSAAESLGMEVITTDTSSQEESLSQEEREMLANFRSIGISAVVCWRDWSAARVLEHCEAKSIQVPDDIAVVGFDGITPDFCPPTHRLTTIVVEWSVIAEEAVEILLKKIEGIDVAEENIHPCSLYFGNTS